MPCHIHCARWAIGGGWLQSPASDGPPQYGASRVSIYYHGQCGILLVVGNRSQADPFRLMTDHIVGNIGHIVRWLLWPYLIGLTPFPLVYCRDHKTVDSATTNTDSMCWYCIEKLYLSFAFPVFFSAFWNLIITNLIFQIDYIVS